MRYEPDSGVAPKATPETIAAGDSLNLTAPLTNLPTGATWLQWARTFRRKDGTLVKTYVVTATPSAAGVLSGSPLVGYIVDTPANTRPFLTTGRDSEAIDYDDVVWVAGSGDTVAHVRTLRRGECTVVKKVNTVDTLTALIPGTTLPASVQVFDGNSLWDESFGASIGNTGGGLPTRAMALVGTGARPFSNFAASGQTTTDMATDAAAQIDAQLDPTKVNVIAVWELTNQLWNITPTPSAAAVGAAMKAYIAARYAAGWDRIVCGTMLPRAGDTGAKETARLAINADIRANPTLYGDVLWDVAADSAWPDATTFSTSGFTGDAVHLNTAGNARVAPGLAAVITTATLLGKRTLALDHAVLTIPATPTVGVAATATSLGETAANAVISSGLTKTYSRTNGTGAATIDSASGAIVYSAAGTVTFSVSIYQASSGLTKTDSVTVTVAASGGGSTLASRLASLVTALGGDANVAGIYHTGIAGAVTNDGDGYASSITDARGASGFGPALVATGTGRPAWNPGTGMLTGDAAGRGLRSAAGFAGFRLNGAGTLAVVYELPTGSETGFVCGIIAADGSTGGGYNTVNITGGAINAQTPTGTIDSGVAPSTTRRLAISGVDADGTTHATVPNHATLTSSATSNANSTTTPALKWFGYSNANSITASSNFIVVTKTVLDGTQISALMTFAAADCGAVAA